MRSASKSNGGGGGVSRASRNNATTTMMRLRSSHSNTNPNRTTATTTQRSSIAVSDFDISRMPRIYRRTRHPWSVHRSGINKYICTIARPDSSTSPSPNTAGVSTHLQFAQKTEREARKFCKVYSPPKFQVGTAECAICQSSTTTNNIPTSSTSNHLCSSANTNSMMVMGGQSASSSSSSSAYNTRRHCRNCGALVCERCSHRWGLRMVPKTFYASSSALTVRVCKSCDWLSNAFCMALLQARYDDALLLYETGNVNLRTSFADIHREAMFPVHCAVMGGSLELVRWLVDTHLCPLSVMTTTRGPKGQLLSVQTSAGRTLMDLAMAGKPKFDILRYLVRKGLSIRDAKDASLAPKTLEAVLKAGIVSNDSPHIVSSALSLPNNNSVVALIEQEEDVDMVDSSYDESVTTSSMMEQDLCALCCEKAMDCVLIPCGHQICCTDCGHQMKNCPVCKVNCSVLRIFRQ